jgi:hypothetical protein
MEMGLRSALRPPHRNRHLPSRKNLQHVSRCINGYGDGAHGAHGADRMSSRRCHRPAACNLPASVTTSGPTSQLAVP